MLIKYPKDIKNEKKFITHVSGFINTANERAKSLSYDNVGKIDDVFAEFLNDSEKNGAEPTLESWKKYHQSKFPNGLEIALEKLKTKTKEIIENVLTINEETLLTYLEDLLYDKTYKGKIIEKEIAASLKSKGYHIISERKLMPSNSVDLIVNGIKIQVKPFTTRHDSHKLFSIDDTDYIYYKIKKEGWEILLPDSLKK